MLRRVALLRVLIAALFAVAAFTASPASAATSTAQQFAADSATWKRAYDTAVAYWGQTPCAGDVETQWRGLERDLNALASWSAIPNAAPSTFSDCDVAFNTELDWDYATFCSVMVHEVGHLLGHVHNDEAGHIMSHVTTTMVPACQTAPAPRASSTRTTSSSTRTTSATRRSPKCTRARVAKLRRSGVLARSSCKRSAALLRR